MISNHVAVVRGEISMFVPRPDVFVNPMESSQLEQEVENLLGVGLEDERWVFLLSALDLGDELGVEVDEGALTVSQG